MSGARVLSEETLHRGFARIFRVRLAVDWNGAPRDMVREIHDHGNVAAAVAVDPVRRAGILLRQFRASPFLQGESGWLWEIPAGLLDGEPPESCARRETQEEAGVALRDVETLGDWWTSPGIVNERVSLFWGVYGGPPPAATGGLDHESEMIEVHEKPMPEIARMLDAGEITDAKSALALYRLRTGRPDLFRP